MTEETKSCYLSPDPFPRHYDIFIHPNLTDFTFTGKVKIQVETKKENPTIDQLILNSVDIKIHNGVFRGANGGEEYVKFGEVDVSYDVDNGRCIITPSKALPTGVNKFEVEIDYAGEINNKMCGFYRSMYKDAKTGESKAMGTTQFEAVDARRAFPCWDEPIHKATFQVTIRTPKGLTSLSNTQIISQTPVAGEAGDVDTTFALTPKMSTYLVAWCIGEFEFIEAKVPRAFPDRSPDQPKETLLRVYTVPGKNVERTGKFALDVGAKVLPALERYFDREWEINKCDMVACPDFAAGAMENWSLIIYRESALLCDENSAAKVREYVALVVAHENIHSYFGNLVTMATFEGLWLNESFTTFVEYLIVDDLFPKWEVFTQFIFDETGRALDLDSRESSHPIQVPIKRAEEIDEIFDVISYCKGCSVLRMLMEYIGYEDFRAGVRKYIAAFAYANATTEDLLKYLSDASGKDLVAVMSNWIYKQGFPILTVKKSAEGAGIEVTQRRFLSGGSAEVQAKAAADETLWSIPLKLMSKNNSKYTAGGFELMNERTKKFAVEVDGADNWVKVNGNQAAFVRVHYADADLLNNLKKPVIEQTLNAVDRFAILADLHAFAQSGIAQTATAMDFAQSYINDEDATVWCAVTSFEAEVRRLLLGESEELKDKFDAWARGIYSKISEKVGFAPNPEKDDHRTASLRANIFSRSSAVRDPKATAAALALWDDLVKNGKSINADLRNAVYATALRERGREAFDKLKELHAKADDAAEAIRIVRILGTAKDEELCKEAAEFCLSDKVRAQDAYVTLVALSGNDKGQQIFEDLLTKGFDRLFEKFPGMIISRVIKSIENMFEVAAGDRILAFIKTLPENKSAQIMRSVHQGIEGLKVVAAWKERDLEGIKKFLA